MRDSTFRFQSCRTGKQLLADLEIGLADAAMVILSKLAMDEGRRVYFNEMDKTGRGENGTGKSVIAPIQQSDVTTMRASNRLAPSAAK